ncbi:Aldolase-II domain-containing protein [Mycena indigotica]|uniref:Carboxylic ester hydrolase n=1 Tax=Mycena indigotica TaxID=2126181 RepID=A0A8H6RYD1_9AGAR|nr:Aldolase-II domain-containing protein [Mycena indigotica]KAF7289183.1 Aldolase-II domain-containing protein [Mycena indigotica]
MWPHPDLSFDVVNLNSTLETIVPLVNMTMTTFAQLALLLLPFSLSSSASDLAKTNIVDLGYARYLGNLSFPNTVAFLGLPYAEPPLDNLRFRAPLPLNTARLAIEAKGRVIDATQYPDFCVQGSTGGKCGDAGGAGSEDCLKVNIYAPAGAKAGDNLPVLVYIHGGGYFFGNPANWPFDHWIHQSPNVVIVSVYYRLDAFGFLSHPEFSADPALGDHNAGFQDQVLALKWVQKHISKFGGDATKVTINGESAGGSSVELHMVANSDKGKNLFRGVIAQSVYRTPLARPEQRVAQFNLFASQAGCGPGSTTEQMKCLRQASVSALARAQDATAGSSTLTGYKLFQPVLDGKTFSDFPTNTFGAGRGFSDVPIIVGATTNETLSGGSSIPDALKSFFPSMSNDDANKLVAAYPVSQFADSTALQFQAATGESELKCARHVIASAVSQRGKAKVWTYRYNQPNPTSGSPAVSHAAENWMMFLGVNTGVNGTRQFTPQTPIETAFASELIAYWLSFVRALDPNTHKLARSPFWKPFSVSDKERMILQEGPEPNASGSFLELQSGEETGRCDSVAELAGAQQN